MSIEPAYVTNEVKGSFWRPDDYMAKVPGEHVIGRTGNDAQNAADQRAAAASVKFSQEGMEKAKGLSKEQQNPNLVFASKDGMVRRISYDILAGQLNQVDITA